MTPKAKTITAVLLLALLALPTGLCSLFFTPVGIGSLFSHDSLEHAIGILALMCSGVGWLVCGVAIWGAVRLNRMAKLESPPADMSPQ
jgi:hypothetical protein